MKVWSGYWIFLILLFLYIFSQPRLNFKDTSTDDIYTLAKTGDILLFRWNKVDLVHNFISFFTHVGIVVEIDDKKYILETHLKGDTRHMGNPNGGVHLYDFKDRVNMYNGHNFLLPLKTKFKSRVHNKIIKDNISRYLKLPFFENYKKYYINQCLPRKFCKTCFSQPSPDTNYIYCSQFVGMILKDLDLINKNTDINCISPYDFIFIKNKKEEIYQDIIYRIRK